MALSLGGIALVDLLATWPGAPVEACVTVGSQAPLLYTFDAIPSMPYDEADPPHLAMPWLNIYDSRDFLSFLAEPLVPALGRARQRGRPARPVGKGLPEVARRLLGSRSGLGCHRHGVQLATRRAVDCPRGAAARFRGAGGAGRERGVKERPPAIRCDPAAADPQGWKLNAALSSTATTAPRVMAERTTSRTPGYLWTSTVHLLFGNPATCVRPVALRPRLATGLPFIARSHAGEALTDGNRLGRRAERRERPKWRMVASTSADLGAGRRGGADARRR